MAQENETFSFNSPVGSDVLLMSNFHGEESISALFSINVNLRSEEKNIAFSKLIGKKATVKFDVETKSGSYRYINGIIGEFIQSGSDGSLALYHATLYPWFWLLTFTNDFKTYQNMSVVEIIEAVFAEFEFSKFEINLKKTYDKREYCTQYNETHYSFISRIMEDEGIFYFFKHSEKEHIMVISDNSSAFENCPHISDIDYRGDDEKGIDNIINMLTLKEQITSNEYIANDYDFKKSNTNITTSKITTRDSVDFIRSMYEFPGNYEIKANGEKKGDSRLEALEFDKKLISGGGNARVLIPGYAFKVTRHYCSDFNKQFVVKSIYHVGEPGNYSNTFNAFPKATTFRPKRATIRPIIYGSQTAIVTGPAGEEIYTDEHGRIKIQFHWDRYGKKDDKSSLWVRVAQNWAGNGFGIITNPRIGQEVVVSFLEGNPDRPLVTGMVYNSMNQVPYNLPADQTMSTIKTNSSKGGSGFNEIRFEDKKDKEEIFVHAQKDYNTVILNDETRKIEHNRTTDINEGNETFIITKGNREETLEEGSDSLALNKGNKNFKLDDGNFDITLSKGNMLTTLTKGDRTVSVLDGNETHLVEKDRKMTVNGNESLITEKKKEISVTDNEMHQNKADFTHEVKGKYVLKVIGDLIFDVTGNIEFKSKGNVEISAKQNIELVAKMKLHSEGMSIEEKASTGWKVDGGALGSIKAAIIKLQ